MEGVAMNAKLFGLIATGMLAVALTLVAPRVVHANLIELTARPATGDTVYWGQLGTPNLSLATPQSFTSTGGTTGNVNLNGTGNLVEQCCIGITGTFDGDFAPGDIDPVSARFMKQDFFEYVPQYKIVIVGNHKPGLRCVNEAIRRRFNLVPFTA